MVARISPAVPEPAVPTPKEFIWKLLAVLVALAVVAVVAVVALVAEVAEVADVAVAALPEIEMPQVPVAFVPPVEGAPIVLYEIVWAAEPL